MKTIILIMLFMLNLTFSQTNVAIGKVTQQSSYSSNGFSSKAVDGNTNGVWFEDFTITHTEIETNPWWRIDLGQIYNISQIKIYNRVDCCSDRLTGAKVYAGYLDSSNPNDYILVKDALNNNALQTIELNITARYIMVYLEGSNKILSLAELEVYGVSSNSTESLWSQSIAGINYNIGNVGIGTTDTKGFKLGVHGKIVAKEVKVAVYNNWADFVFSKNYDLPTLKEVEQHIQEKGHLKDIPSAEDVKENGIFLGEMDSKLLQKIEELTLYAIEQQKEIDSLKSIIYEVELLKQEFKKLNQNRK